MLEYCVLPETKTCSRCELELPVARFYERKKRTNWCKSCHKSYRTVYRATRTPDAILREKIRSSEYTKKRRRRINLRLKAKRRASPTWREPYTEHERRTNKRLSNARWRKAHPEQYLLCIEANRAKRRGIQGEFTLDDYWNQYYMQDGKCQYCAKKRKMTIDHVIPMSRLNLRPTNWPDNVVLACLPCNASKNAKTLEEWAESAYYKKHCRIVPSI